MLICFDHSPLVFSSVAILTDKGGNWTVSQWNNLLSNCPNQRQETWKRAKDTWPWIENTFFLLSFCYHFLNSRRWIFLHHFLGLATFRLLHCLKNYIFELHFVDCPLNFHLLHKCSSCYTKHSVLLTLVSRWPFFRYWI